MSIHHKTTQSPRCSCPGKTPREAPLLLRWICLGGGRLTVVTEAEGELVMTMCRDRGEVQVNGEKVKAGDAPWKESSQWMKEGVRLL